MAIGGAVIASLAFTSGWVVNGWRHSATELGKLTAAIDAAETRVNNIGTAAEASAQRLAAINSQALEDSRRIASYAAQTNACRVTAADISVFTGAEPATPTD
jgi:hypothetical protein